MRKIIYTIFMLMIALGVEAQVDTTESIHREKGWRRKAYRIDREINKIKFAYKGEFILGMTASYMTLSEDNTEFLFIVNNIGADGYMVSIKPYVGYLYRDNRCIGVRFQYSQSEGTLDAANIDLGPSNDIAIDIPYIATLSEKYSVGIFHRAYAGLDPKGRFGLFADVEIKASKGTSEFTYEMSGERKTTYNNSRDYKIMFNPGVAVYILPNVCSTLSFGLGGVNYSTVQQVDKDGNEVGSRISSGMNFKLNIAAINIGMTIHLWNNKKI